MIPPPMIPRCPPPAAGATRNAHPTAPQDAMLLIVNCAFCVVVPGMAMYSIEPKPSPDSPLVGSVHPDPGVVAPELPDECTPKMNESVAVVKFPLAGVELFPVLSNDEPQLPSSGELVFAPETSVM